jgi:hypothetical protein
MSLESRSQQARKAVQLIAICEPIFNTMWEPRRLTTIQASSACYGNSFAFILQRKVSAICPTDNLQHQVTQFMTTETSQPF